MRVGEGLLRRADSKGKISPDGQASLSIQVDKNHLSAVASKDQLRRFALCRGARDSCRVTRLNKTGSPLAQKLKTAAE